MAKVVVFGVAGDDGLWVADLDAGTIAPLRSPTTLLISEQVGRR
jgi:hypothetical protein